MAFTSVKPGDVVRLTRTLPGRTDLTQRFIVGSVGSSVTVGATITDKQNFRYFEADGWIIDPKIGRTDLDDCAGFIAWNDYDHEPHVAIRYGHPANKVWKYNGQRMMEVDLLNVIDNFIVASLVFE
jgi:hypothetical protein